MTRAGLPSGTVTFLFTDVEGSTRLLHELGAEGYAAALAGHRAVVREAVLRHGGVEVDTQGDAFFVAFPTAVGAVAAAGEMQAGLAAGPVRVRVGVHTGTPHLAEEGYVGVDVHRAARIAAAGHGGQVLVSAAAAALVERAGLVDLGEHRLKDLSAPERIFQLGEGGFAPLKTLYRTNLPVPAAPFLGRERELAAVLGLLEGSRVLTLSGPGGTGKTRLGLQAAADQAERFPDGVFWVPLAPLRDAALVLETAAGAVGASNGLVEHVADRRLLLLLDNFEHLIPAAEELAALVAACPNLTLLVTSRELLRIPGEQAYPVPPLDPQDGSELFLARALAARPDFAPTPAVEELCARLDNLPLALELAAARVRVLSPEQLLERISQRLDLLKGGRGGDPRQQTLRTTIEWSHELLDGEEQRLFAQLSVFRGGCTLEAAEAVCDADLDVLQSLVDKSLLGEREGERFWMLETIREYAAERLDASPEREQLTRRHADHYLTLAERAFDHLRGEPGEWLGRLEADHDNLRAAVDCYEAAGETQLVLQLTGALARFWYMQSQVTEPQRRLEAALADDDAPTTARARALTGAAMIAIVAGDHATARARAEDSLELHQRLDDPLGAAHARYLLGNAATVAGDFITARPIFEQSVQALRELGEDHYSLVAMRALAWASEELGDEDRYRELYLELLPLARTTGNTRMEARALSTHAAFAREEGRVEEALSLAAEALRLDLASGEFNAIIQDLSGIAATLAVSGRAQIAAQLVAAVQALHDERGADVPRWVADGHRETLEHVRAALDESSAQEATASGSTLSLDDAVELAIRELPEGMRGELRER